MERQSPMTSVDGGFHNKINSYNTLNCCVSPGRNSKDLINQAWELIEAPETISSDVGTYDLYSSREA